MSNTQIRFQIWSVDIDLERDSTIHNMINLLWLHSDTIWKNIQLILINLFQAYTFPFRLCLLCKIPRLKIEGLRLYRGICQSDLEIVGFDQVSQYYTIDSLNVPWCLWCLTCLWMFPDVSDVVTIAYCTTFWKILLLYRAKVARWPLYRAKVARWPLYRAKVARWQREHGEIPFIDEERCITLMNWI